MTELIRYQIETRHPVTGYWEVQRECRCKYERESTERRFLWFVWSKTRITNWRSAELQCRKEVMICCRAYEKEHEDVRVTKTEYTSGSSWKDVVWENGVWKDC